MLYIVTPFQIENLCKIEVTVYCKFSVHIIDAYIRVKKPLYFWFHSSQCSVARRTSREAARATVVDMLPRQQPGGFSHQMGLGYRGRRRYIALVRRYEGHDQEVYAKLIFKSAATILREIGFAFFPPLDRDTSNSTNPPHFTHLKTPQTRLLCVACSNTWVSFSRQKWIPYFCWKMNVYLS